MTLAANFAPFADQMCLGCKKYFPLAEMRPVVTNGVLVGLRCQECAT